MTRLAAPKGSQQNVQIKVVTELARTNMERKLSTSSDDMEAAAEYADDKEPEDDFDSSDAYARNVSRHALRFTSPR